MTEDLLRQLHDKLAETLLTELKKGDPQASMLNVIRQFLKDNGIDAVPKEGSPLGDLVNNLPNFDDLNGDIGGKPN